MTIKKPMKAAGAAAAPAAPAAGGGATIANRFKLDMAEPAKKSASSTATTVAAYAGIAAFIVAGVLTYMLWKHWDFLMPA